MNDASKTRSQLYAELEDLCRQVRRLGGTAQDSQERDAGEKRIETLLLDAQELQAVGILARGVGHAMNNVLSTDNGPAAVDIIRQGEEIDLVVLDLHMPGMDGAECLVKLKEASPSLPVLICTGYSSPQESEELMATGALGVIRKPFDTEELAAAIAAAMEQAALQQ